MKFIFFLSLPLYALDQWTKYLVIRDVPPNGAAVHVFPKTGGFFDIVNVTNTGAAFGSFKGNNTFFIALSIVALLVVVVLLVRRRATDVWRDVSLALLLAGILGNLTDRLLHGHVIDFLVFYLHFASFVNPWPAFNIADSCICVAVVCFIIHSFLEKKTPDATTNTPAP
ncbi:MAG TPA: signal peptidase II [Chthoniobacterales bacterium]|nr:signal peptidase II [Chthoniobacterales bacterium]